MLHTHDEFINAIEAEPGDRTLRLVFADWLEEHNDPRAEHIRIEEEMRTLPAFADRFWELKPRRNKLRETAGTGWCEALGYGTDVAPLFAHGVPTDRTQRWRLVREFTERWYRVPMPDVGTWQKEVAQEESRVRRKFPASLREWYAFIRDAQQNRPHNLPFWQDFSAHHVPDNTAFALSNDGDAYCGVRDEDFTEPDPPVHVYRATGSEWYNDDYQPTNFVHSADNPEFATISEFALRHVAVVMHGPRPLVLQGKVAEDIRNAAWEELTLAAQFGGLDVFEADNVLFAFGEVNWHGPEEPAVWVRSTPRGAESLPPKLRAIIEKPVQAMNQHASGDDPIPF